MPIASVTLAPHPASSLARMAGSPPPGSPATMTRFTLEALRSTPRALSPLDEMKRIGRRHRDDGRLQELDRRHQPLGVSGADRDVAEPEPVECAKRRAGDERAGVIGRDDALAALEARGRIGARRGPHPDFEIGGGQRNIARRSGRAAGRIDPDDLFGRGGQMGADRLVGRARAPELVLFGQRQRRRSLRDRRRRRESRIRPARASCDRSATARTDIRSA